MSEAIHLLIDRFPTPIGEMILVADRDGSLRAVDWTEHEARMRRLLRLHYGDDGFELEPARNPHGLGDVLDSYFAGEVSTIDALPVQTAGTPFQREVWRTLREIACGTTVSTRSLRSESAGRAQ